MADFRLQIVTQQRTVFDRPVSSVVMPGEEGFFGIMANHAPIIAVLTKGPVDIRIGNHTDRIEISGGFFEMENNEATMLADSVTGLKEETKEEE